MSFDENYYNKKSYNPNNEPLIAGDLNLDVCKFPIFMKRFMFEYTINNVAKLDFMYKFGFRYLLSDNFREKVDGYVFLFIDEFYHGCFSDGNEALQYTKQNNFYDNGHNIFIRYMYIPDYNETAEMISRKHIVFNDKNNKISYKKNISQKVHASIGNVHDPYLINNCKYKWAAEA